MKILSAFLLINFILCGCQDHIQRSSSSTILFNDGWEFIISSDSTEIFNPKHKAVWAQVRLPHTPKKEPLIVNDQWQGICWYRKKFKIPDYTKNKLLFLKFEGAMNVAEVWVNGVNKIKHFGGYLPFTIDITHEAIKDGYNEIIVKLDNRDNPVTGPKPLDKLDFNMYGGLYRDVYFITKDRLHITDPIFTDKSGGGGIFVTYPMVSNEQATIQIKTHIQNSYSEDKECIIQHKLIYNNSEIELFESELIQIDTESAIENQSEIILNSPNLWSPVAPNLYTLLTNLIFNDEILDSDTTRIGIRRFDIQKDHFSINGEEMFLRGINRHQEYPYIGYSLSNVAQYRDAKKIKDAGFDYVRLSHYPHSPAFMDACDELGLVVIDAILGWQYFSEDDRFQSQAFQSCKNLIRRDRNHACVMAWEVSLNESWMPEDFIDKAILIAKEEYPNDQCYTAGWQEYGYDIYLQARQHRINHYEKPGKPYIVSEYGDWEYYAMNAGLNQDTWQDLVQEKRSSRQLLGNSEKQLLQQATNIQEAHNDNFNTTAFADGYWVMFDYNRGYANDLEASGIMSINRLPKFSYYFFQSQRDPDDTSDFNLSGPMVFIASYWNNSSDLDIRVFSNCEEVELSLNDNIISKQKPDSNRNTNNLTHPPFTFNLDKFEKGTLKAIAYLDGKEVTSHMIQTPKSPIALKLRYDVSGRPPVSGFKDAIFIYAEIVDQNGTTVPLNGQEVEFNITGDAHFVSPAIIKTEAGIASSLLQIGQKAGQIIISATSKDITKNEITIVSN